MSSTTLWRTLLRVKRKKTNLAENKLIVSAPGWNHRKPITIDPALVPADIVAKIEQGLTEPETIYLFARMNLGAEKVKDVVFDYDSFEFAPKPRFETLEEYFTKPDDEA